MFTANNTVKTPMTLKQYIQHMLYMENLSMHVQKTGEYFEDSNHMVLVSSNQV